MNAEIISIGDELLIGQTINTNATFIAQKLTEIGVEVKWITCVGDDEDQIKYQLSVSEKRSQVIILTGGLGPTHDDVTKKVLVRYFRSNLILNQQLLDELRKRFEKRKIKMAKCNEAQALVPDNAIILDNRIGTAPGLLFQKDRKYFFVLPGVPVEMKAITIDHIVPFLQKKSRQVLKKRIIHTMGIPESTLFEYLGDIKEIEKIVKIGFLPQTGRVDIKLLASGRDKKDCTKKINQVEKIILSKIGNKVWGFDEDSYEDVIVQKLSEKKKILSIIEVGTKGEVISQLFQAKNAATQLTQGTVLGSLKKLFQILPNPVSDGESIDEPLVRKLAPIIREYSGSDLILMTINKGGSDVYSVILITNEEVVFRDYIFPFDTRLSIKRLITESFNILFQYLSQKNLLD